MITCYFENGNKATKGLRHVTVGAIAVNEKGEILLVKRAPTVPNPNKWSVPGGFFDQGETTEEAVLRELQEETGLTGKIRCLFHINDNPNRPKEDRQNVDFIYIVDVTSGETKTDWETLSVAWFTKETLPADKDFAYDHRNAFVKYFEYIEKPFLLPLMGDLAQ